MDNRNSNESMPSVTPYVRTRRSAAARAAAQAAAAQNAAAQAAAAQNAAAQNAAAQAAAAQNAAVQAPAAPAGFVPAQQPAPDQAPAVRNRAVQDALTAPVVYDPGDRELRMPSVEPVKLNAGGSGRGARSSGKFMVISILLGVLSGLFLFYLNEQNGLLSTTDFYHYEDFAKILHCVLWGGVFGLLFSLIFSRPYRRMGSVMPLFAVMLFFPLTLYLLMPLLCMGSALVVALIGAAISLIGAGIGLFLVYSFLCG